jgi:hypothetical protein
LLLVAILVIVAAMPSVACYSGLLVIPTADTVGANQYDIELQVDGTTEKLKADTYLLNTQFGLGNRLELGVDVDLHEKTDDRFLFNGKYVLAKSADGKLAIAAGVCNFSSTGDLDANPYLVATRDFGVLRGTLGTTYLNKQTQAIIGIDKALNPHLTLMADYTTGNNNYTSAAFNYHFTDRVGLMAGVELPNSSANDTRFSVHLVFNGPYRTAKGAK